MVNESMSLLRLTAVVFSMAALIALFSLFRARRIGRSDVVIGGALFLAIGVVAADPDLANFVVDFSHFNAPYGRLLALLVISSGLLWSFMFYERIKRAGAALRFDKLLRALALKDFEAQRGDASPDVLVVMPAYNEADNLGSVLRRIPKHIDGESVGVLVVDDGSSDDTYSVARRAGAWAIHALVNRGQGAAVRIGFDVAALCGSRVIVTLDADGQHEPAEIAAVARPVLRGEHDIVIGSRVLGSSDGGTLLRRAGVTALSRVVNLLATTRVTDCSSGFRAYRVDVARRLEFREDQFYSGEIIMEGARKAFRIGEVPITIRPRASGTSKKGSEWKYGLCFAKGILKGWWR
jgi:hypothetical protein